MVKYESPTKPIGWLLWVFPKNNGTPQILKWAFSIIFTIHFGGKIPLFLETSIVWGLFQPPGGPTFATSKSWIAACHCRDRSQALIAALNPRLVVRSFNNASKALRTARVKQRGKWWNVYVANLHTSTLWKTGVYTTCVPTFHCFNPWDAVWK